MGRIADKILNWLLERSDVLNGPRIDKYIRCPDPDCDRRMLFRDVFEHFFTQHWEHDCSEDHEQPQEKPVQRKKVSRAELLNGNYEIDWETEDDDDGIEIQEPTGGSGQVQVEKLESFWKPALKEIELSGSWKINRSTHYGSLRGAHIVQRFKQDLKRMDIDMDLEFHDDSYPMEISET